MANGNRGISDSHLATIARRRVAIDRTRQTLGLGTEMGAPQAPTRAIPNPPPQPVPSGKQAPGQLAPAGEAAAPNSRAAMLEKAKAFLDQQQRPQSQPMPQNGIDVQAPTPDTTPLTDQVAGLGAAGISPEQQFYRLSGRMPSPREMAVFRATMLLEGQLNRRPTANELRASLMRPDSISQSFPSVVEA